MASNVQTIVTDTKKERKTDVFSNLQFVASCTGNIEEMLQSKGISPDGSDIIAPNLSHSLPISVMDRVN